MSIYNNLCRIPVIITNANLLLIQKQVYIFQYKYVYTLIGARLLGKLKICIDSAGSKRVHCIVSILHYYWNWYFSMIRIRKNSYANSLH